MPRTTSKMELEGFGNVNKMLNQKKEKLQQLELRDSLHGNAEEIKRVRKEINEI